MNKFIKFCTAFFVLVCTTTNVQAALVTGGATTIEPTIDLGGSGLLLNATGNAVIGESGTGGFTFEFPISGGDLDPSTLAGTILHVGGGLDIVGISASGTTTISLEDFVIDTTTQQVFASVSSTVSALGGLSGTTLIDANAAIFDFNLGQLSNIEDLFVLTNPQLILTVSDTLSAILLDYFELTVPAGTEFGLAATAPTLEASEVPLPGAAILFLTGLVGYSLRRKA